MAGKSAVIRAEEARPKTKADKRTAAEKAGAVTGEAHNSAAKAKEAAAANDLAKRQAAKVKETELQAAEIKEKAARHARKTEAAKCKEQQQSVCFSSFKAASRAAWPISLLFCA